MRTFLRTVKNVKVCQNSITMSDRRKCNFVLQLINLNNPRSI